MNKSQPTEREIKKEINSLITIDLPDGELYDIVQAVAQFCYDSFKAGMEEGNDEGYQNGKREAFDDENAVEKINTEYCVAQFADCNTLADFHSKLTEIRNRSYNFMT